ncbi:hypothetical protein STVIR_1305 [Streptomyces viridochromogenes Tue57]|uniref:Uncharacterized protein n=1 Tax=Streptomyces viridochromogenes Tue57 TaxID=1160705 RepID=L8PJM4_STRVR|nr:hypothetical protein STVIR_1305 [Streptomyces viridochromogenes Tue57]
MYHEIQPRRGGTYRLLSPSLRQVRHCRNPRGAKYAFSLRAMPFVMTSRRFSTFGFTKFLGGLRDWRGGHMRGNYSVPWQPNCGAPRTPRGRSG